jgi:small subunit ribosomal protein S5
MMAEEEKSDEEATEQQEQQAEDVAEATEESESTEDEQEAAKEAAKEKMEEVAAKSETKTPQPEKKQKKQERHGPNDWTPRTKIGKKVRTGEITHIDEILDWGKIIMEPEIVDTLLDLQDELILVGQSKGKFGGGQRRVFKQTQKKTKEGNKPQFTAMAIVGNRDGYVGVGLGKSKETVPARDKALAKAKKNIFKIRRGCGSWEGTDGPNSIPFTVEGQCGSVRIKLMPAPKGKGLVCEDEVAKVLELAGIEDIWSKSFGHTENKINLIKAVEAALKKLMRTKITADPNTNIEIYEGSVHG